jgi:CubicO group peptidase (beta-lactamase class C family)
MDILMTAKEPASPLLHAFELRVFADAFSHLQQAIAQQTFPGASVAVTQRGKLVALLAFGQFTYEPNSPLVNPSTLFDLASLTKVVATTTMAMLLYERSLLDLEAPVSAIVPEFTHDAARDPRRHEVTLRMLLAHSSGLPAYEKLFLTARTRDQLLQSAFTTPLARNPATRADYSDIGFIIFGIALERLADESLDRFCQREIFAPLSMTNTTFNPPAELRAKIPPTADEREEPCGSDTPVRQLPAASPPPSGSQQIPSSIIRSTFRNRIIQGEVQD